MKRVALLTGLLIMILVMVTLVISLAFGIPQIWLSSISPVRNANQQVQEANQDTSLDFTSGQLAEMMAVYQALENPAVSSIQARLEKLQPSPDGTYEFTVTASEINEILAKSLIVPRNSAGVELQNLSVAFYDSTIVLTASVNDPFSAELTLSLLPLVENGSVRLIAESVALGSVQVPNLLLMPVQALVDEAMDQALASVPVNVKLQAVTITDGQMTVAGQQS